MSGGGRFDVGFGAARIEPILVGPQRGALGAGLCGTVWFKAGFGGSDDGAGLNLKQENY